jgi:hypothetical protein
MDSNTHLSYRIKHQSLDLIDGWESLQSVKVNLADLLVHGPQSTHIIDLIGDGRSMTRIRLESSEHFSDCERWDPAITVNHRSMNGDRGWGIIAEHEGESSGCASSRPAIH